MEHHGFMLIALIVVLGNFTVTTAPRFIDFQGDARKAMLRGGL